MPLIECVPNFSEGRNADTLDALRAALTSVPGVRLLDAQADPSHNRSVFTAVAPPEAALEAAFRSVKLAGPSASTCGSIAGSTRAWARPTWCRSSRWWT